MATATAVRAIRSRVSTPRSVPLKRTRFWLICLFFFAWACVIAGRLFWLQVVRHADYVERAVKQQQRTVEIAPRRGVLYDRNLHELAMTVLVDSIYADPSEMSDKQAMARTLSSVTHTDPADSHTTEKEILDRLNTGHNFAWIARRVTPEVAAKIRALNINKHCFKTPGPAPGTHPVPAF